MNSIDDYILKTIENTKKGAIFFTEDFLQFGNAKAISKALERLVNKDILSRVARGMYALLKEHKEFGKIYPTAEEIAQAVARRDNARIVRTGIWAQYALGLTTQIPLKAVYLTDGSARTIKVKGRTIKLKKTSPKNLSAIGPISSLVIQALKIIGKDKLSVQEEKTILKHLNKEAQDHIKHDIKLAPEWIRVIMRKALKENTDG